MISVQLADLLHPYIGASEKPSEELVEKYSCAANALSNSFTLQLTPDDEKYLYLRFKKIKNDTGLLDFLKRPYLLYSFYVSLFGYDTSQLMQQYIQKVESLGVDISSANSKKTGFSKGPSKMQANSDSTFSDEDFSSKQAQLVDYIRDGDIDEVRNLLSSDSALVNLHYCDVYPIHVAADVGKLEILQELIESGANLNQKDAEGQTALHYGACNGYSDVVKLLLDSGIDSKVLCNENTAALDVASDPEIIDLLKAVE